MRRDAAKYTLPSDTCGHAIARLLQHVRDCCRASRSRATYYARLTRDDSVIAYTDAMSCECRSAWHAALLQRPAAPRQRVTAMRYSSGILSKMPIFYHVEIGVAATQESWR